MATAGALLPQTASSFRFAVETSEHDDGLAAFAPVRRRLFGIAYNMLGNAAEAEDIVQEVWLRCPRNRAAKPAWGHAFPNRWTPLAIQH